MVGALFMFASAALATAVDTNGMPPFVTSLKREGLPLTHRTTWLVGPTCSHGVPGKVALFAPTSPIERDTPGLQWILNDLGKEEFWLDIQPISLGSSV
jgi:hypothetical protein